MIRIAALLAATCLVGCSSPERSASVFTLYRNSNISPSLRVHWGTFDASESDPTYNANNCAMAARLLNANMRESAKAEGLTPHFRVGFWCEPGSFSEQGQVPSSFEAAFPTDTP